ncbi:putative polysulfide reductase chain A [Candidatus Hydrogenisulfobacillus filiaventi]|uniref:Putative polysulfide reductase chain A n=1 Tax=Candidatus Hydrogenisulfobacillus filiaventi TaxID=2707344 RepID=A0A6F8ZGG5_9FIRM|nr:putative polysulfide reductase chain A [Candidatus Hydrogenisulfobacillus filiaventi]
MKVWMTRRDFVKTSAMIGAGLTVLGPRTLEKVVRAESSSPDEYKAWAPNICTMCASGCGVVVQTKGQGSGKRALKIDGNPLDPFNQGRICPRGQSGLRLAYYPERITTPLIRVPGSKRGEWRFRAASWDEAYRYIQDKITANNIKRHEMGIAAGWVICAYYRPEVVSFAMSIGMPNIYGTPMQPCVTGSHFGSDTLTGNFNIHDEVQADYENAKYFIAFGNNSSFAGISTGRGLRFARGMRDNGTKVVIVDPRMSEAAAHADEWVPIRPGTDLALALAMANVIVTNRYYDAPYLAKYSNMPFLVDASGPFPQLMMDVDPKTQMPTRFYVFDETRQTVVPVPGMFGRNQVDVNGVEVIPALTVPAGTTAQGKKVLTVFQVLQERLKAYTPEWAADITALPAAQIRHIAEEFGQTRPALVEPGWHDGRYPNSVMLRRTLALLQLLVGGYDVPGGWVFSGSYHEDMANMMKYLAGGGDLAKYPPMAIPGITSPMGVMNMFSDPSFWPEGFPQITTAWSEQEVKAGRDPVAFPLFTNVGWDAAIDGRLQWKGQPYRLRAIWMYQANPVRNAMSAAKWQEMLSNPNLPLVVAIDIAPNDSNIYADVILPDQVYLEKEDELFDLGHSHQVGVRMRVPALEPPKDTRPALDILAQMAAMLHGDWAGTLAMVRGWDANQVRHAVQKALNTGKSVTLAIQQYQIRSKAKEWGVNPQALEAELRKNGLVVHEQASEVLAKWAMPEKLPVPTISGRLEAYSLVLAGFVRQYGYKPEWDPLVTFVEPNWKPGEGLHPRLQGNEFFFAYGKTPLQSHCATLNNDLLVSLSELRRDQITGIWLHSKAAQRLGIKNGDKILLTNQVSGQRTTGIAYVTEMVRPDTVYMMSDFGAQNSKVYGHGVGTALSAIVPARPEMVVGAPQSGAFTITVERA